MKSPRSFDHIDTWVFDLDNTLYPHHVNLWQQVDAKIGEFVSAWLKVSPEAARLIQKDYYRRYGTTMRGMMTEHGVRAADLPQVFGSPRRRADACGDVRGPRPQPRGAARTRHDHGAGGARRQQGSG